MSVEPMLGACEHPLPAEDEEMNGTTEGDDTNNDADAATESRRSSNASLNFEEKMLKAEALKESGNLLLKQGMYSEALTQYDKGIGITKKYIDAADNYEEQSGSAKIYIPLHLNAAQACLKMENFSKCKGHASQVLEIDKTNVKALYRRGCANRGGGDLELAEKDLLEVVRLEPSNKHARIEIQAVREQSKEQKMREKEQFQKAFQKPLYDEEHKKLARLQKEYAMYKETREGEEEVKSFRDWQEEKTEKEARERDHLKARREEEEALVKTAESEAPARPKATEVVQCTEEDLDEEEKKLLSEVKGKGYYHGRLHTVPSDRAPSPSLVGTSEDLAPSDLDRQGSAWNQAGTTWEEKNMSDVVKDLFSATVKGAEGAVVADSACGRVKVSRASASGVTAYIATVRGTNRYFFELTASITVKYLAEVAELQNEGTCSFEMTDSTKIDSLVPPIAWTGGDDVSAQVRDVATEAVRAGLRRFVYEYGKS